MKEKPCIIIGSGGHGQVLLDILLDLDVKIIGFLEKDVNMKGGDIYGIPVLGTDEEIYCYDSNEIELVNGVGSIGVASLRRKIYEKFKGLGYSFRQVIHRTAVISSRAILEEGVQVMAGAVINIGSRIGENAVINTKASVDHDCRIGKHVHVAPGVALSGGVFVGDATLVGVGSSVKQGISIGENVLIGAGSNVVKNIPARTKVFGNPVVIQ